MKWAFNARFRRREFGWKSQPAILRIREAVRETSSWADRWIDLLRKRPYLQMDWIESVVAEPARREVQSDGRIRSWGYIPPLGRYLRVVTLADGTVHNAFFDRGFGDPAG